MTVANQPARSIVLLYLATAHLALGVASMMAGLWPQAVAGFFYHSWMVGVVHLVTIGWITFSIFGAMFLVAPLALRTAMPAFTSDYITYAAAVIGLVGMVGHFWIQEYRGMAWSAGLLASSVMWMTARIIRVVWRAPIQSFAKRLIVLACANIWVAATTGLLIASDKTLHFLPGFVLTNVFAHAHLAALGWGTMMVLGVGSRLLPMILPAKMPAPGLSGTAAVVLLEIGVIGLFSTLLLRAPWAIVFGLAFAAGLAICGAQIVWMVRHRVPKPRAVGSPDYGVGHAAAAGLWLVVATTVGIALLALPTTPGTLQLAAAYGVAGLVGFLAQMVAAMEARLLPMAVWFWAYADSNYQVAPESPHAMRDRSLQAMVFGGWTIGVPALAAGMALESARLVGIGAWSLFAAVSLATIDHILVVARTFRSTPASRFAAPLALNVNDTRGAAGSGRSA